MPNRSPKYNQPDRSGHFGIYGGKFVPETLMAALGERLRKRKTETPQARRMRLRAAKRELACAAWYDYAVVNRRVQDAVEQVHAIVTAERLRRNDATSPD